MGPRPPKPLAEPAKRPARPVLVERRDLGTDRPRIKAKPDAAVQLREVAAVMQDLPRDCLIDRAELLILMRRLAGRLVSIAETGLEAAPSHRSRAPRQPFLLERRPDARVVAEAVFGKSGCGRRGDQVGTVKSRKGVMVRVEVRRARAGGQMELSV